MANYKVSRDGMTKFVGWFVKHLDGSLWAPNDTPLINSQAPETIAMGLDNVIALIKGKKWDKIPRRCYAHEGQNPSGLLVENLDALREQAKASRTPAQIEREKIAKLYYEARKLENSDSEDNVAGPTSMRAEADRLLKKWRETYPAEAREEKAQELEDMARKEKELAAGALIYDADGSLSAEDQQQRHDDHMRRAEEYIQQAKTLRAKD